MQSSTTFIHRLTIGLGSVLGATSAGTALAASGYILDSEGQVVTSGFGECVKNGAWHQDLSTPECDPALAARL